MALYVRISDAQRNTISVHEIKNDRTGTREKGSYDVREFFGGVLIGRIESHWRAKGAHELVRRAMTVIAEKEEGQVTKDAIRSEKWGSEYRPAPHTIQRWKRHRFFRTAWTLTIGIAIGWAVTQISLLGGG